MRRSLTIGYLTVDDPRDRRTWSGINHFLLRAIEGEGHRVVVLGPLRPQAALLFCRLVNQVALRLFGKRFHYRDSFIMARAYARVLQRRLAHERMDLIIAPAGIATTALLRTTVPIVYINDRCIAGAIGYHKVLKDLLAFSRRQSLALERKALERAHRVIYASHWAADAARAAYPDLAAGIQVIPFGANLEKSPPAPAPRAFPPEKLKLLFLGVYWDDKGGPIAYRALIELKRRGVDAELVVCGCDPPPECDDPDLVREGFLNKNIPADLEKLERHLDSAHFLIVPTRFEAYGIVFCEAAAHGLPVLATRTGGVPTIVEDGRTGFLFDLDEGGAAYAERIARLIGDPQGWRMMRANARARYEGSLTWTAFTRAMLDQLDAGASNAR